MKKPLQTKMKISFDNYESIKKSNLKWIEGIESLEISKSLRNKS